MISKFMSNSETNIANTFLIIPWILHKYNVNLRDSILKVFRTQYSDWTKKVNRKYIFRQLFSSVTKYNFKVGRESLQLY